MAELPKGEILMSEVSYKTFTIPASRKNVFDLKQVSIPFTYIVRPASGVSISRKSATANRPGGKFASPPQTGSFDDTQGFNQMSPLSFIEFSNGAGEAKVDIAGVGLENITIHDSVDDTATVLTHDGVAISIGDTHEVGVGELFNYPKGAMATRASSSSPLVAGAKADDETGKVYIIGVTAGTSTISVIGTTPTGQEVTATIAVTVSA